MLPFIAFKDSAGNSWINVMVWVAVSLLFFEGLNFFTRDKFIRWIERSKKTQPFLAAMLGIIPGCGASLFLVPLYNKRQITFGTLTATFISTMGDASFIILTGDPMSFLIITLFTCVIAIIVGYAIDLSGLGKKIEKKSDEDMVLKEEIKLKKISIQKNITEKEKKFLPDWYHPTETYFIMPLFWLLILMAFPNSIMVLSIPGLTDDKAPPPPHGVEVYNEIMTWMSLVAVILFISWYILRKIMLSYYIHRDDRVHVDDIHYGGMHKTDFVHILKDTTTNSLFMLIWIFIGTYMFDLTSSIADNVSDWENNPLNKKHDSWLIWWISSNKDFQIVMVIIGCIVGLLPGCGPQIVFARVFLGGAANSAALTANTISQDGDASFPLLAVDKRGFIIIKIINFIPAIIIGLVLIIPQLSWTTGSFS